MEIIMNTHRSLTTLGIFGRSIRDEPDNLVYKHNLFMGNDLVSVEEVVAWLKVRYVDHQRGHRFRVVTYPHQNGNRYVHCIKLETLTDTDLTYITLKWGIPSKTRVQRGERYSRKRLTKEQRKALDAKLEQVKKDFYSTMGW